MEKKRAPSEAKAQALRALLQGQSDAQSGEAFLSPVVRVSPDRVWPEALEQEQATAWGRGRYEARGEHLGYRQGEENGTRKTAAGVVRGKVPQGRGRAEPERSPWGRQGATTSAVGKRLSGELDVGGRWQRDRESSCERALGQCVLSQSPVREVTDPWREESAAWRRRARSPEAVASLCIATGYDPLRRWGQKTGVLGGGALGEEGRKVLRRLSTPQREREASWLEVCRGVAKRGRPPPVPIPTDGAVGLTPALAALGPQAWRLGGGVHQRQKRHQKIPAPLWPEVTAVLGARRAAPTPQKAEKRRAALVAPSPRELPAAGRGVRAEAAASLPPRAVPHRPQP